MVYPYNLKGEFIDKEDKKYIDYVNTYNYNECLRSKSDFLSNENSRNDLKLMVKYIY